MKVKLLLPLNIEGRQYAAMSEADLDAKEAKALIRGGFAQAVKERAVPQKPVEVRTDPVAEA